jgi:hypothetical protein
LRYDKLFHPNDPCKPQSDNFPNDFFGLQYRMPHHSQPIRRMTRESFVTEWTLAGGLVPLWTAARLAQIDESGITARIKAGELTPYQLDGSKSYLVPLPQALAIRPKRARAPTKQARQA